MTKHIIAGFVVFLLFTLAGCKVWIKRGAGPDQLSRDQSECSTRVDGDQSDEAYIECMQSRGWYHQDKSLEPSGSDAAQRPDAQPSHTQSLEQDRPGGEEKSPPDEHSGTGKATHDTQHPGKYTVGSWWKIGGSPEQLRQDQDDCRTEAGSADESRTLQWTATPEFVRCMKNKGWYGFSE